MRPRSIVTILLSLAFLPIPMIAQFRQVAVLGHDFVSSFATDSSGFYAASYSGGLYRSTDDGANWKIINQDLGTRGILSLLTVADRLYIGTSGSGVYRSNDHGVTATPVNSGLFLPIEIYSMASTDSSIYAGAYSQGIQRSGSRDDRWYTVAPFGSILSMAASGSKIFASSNRGGIFRSLDDGRSWTFEDSGMTNRHIAAVAFDGHRVYASSKGYGIIDEFPKTSATIGYEVFLSTDDGITWAVVFDASLSQQVIRFAFLGGSVGDSLIAAGTPSGIFVTTNPPTTWTNISAGLPSESIFSIAVHSSYLFAGTYSGTVWRRPISEVITSVTRLHLEPPMDFTLSQNYPNPFNSVTRIRLASPVSTTATVKVYDVLGREVSILLAQMLHPGSYDLVFDASGLPSGIYYCRFLAGNFSRAIKLVLQK